MFLRKQWLSILVGCILLLLATGCQQPMVDEEARAQLATLEANQAAIQAELEDVSSQVTALSNQVTTEAAGAEFGMTFRIGLEVIHQDSETPQRSFFPIDRLALYRSLEEFQSEWIDNDDKNTNSGIHMAFLADPTPDAWQLYYTTKVITNTVTWESPAWRRHRVRAQWPSGETNRLSGTVSVDLGEKQPINGHTEFLANPIMRDSVTNLQMAVTANGSDLTAANPILFLVHDRSEGQDEVVLVVIDMFADTGPDPSDDPPVGQYCSSCQGFWCWIRCW